MNRFGRFARDAWQTLAPAAYQQIEDPNRHFSTLGDQAMEAWADLWRQLAGPDQPGEGFLEKVGRLENAKLRAEEMIREELLTPPPEQIEPDEQEEAPDRLTQMWAEVEAETQAWEQAQDPSAL